MSNQPGDVQKIQLITDADIQAGNEKLQPGKYQKEFLDGLAAVIAESENKVQVIASSGVAQTLDVDTYAAFNVTLDDNCVFTFGEPLEDFEIFQLTLIQDAGGGNSVTWPASVEWDAGAAPVLITSPNNKTVLTFSTDDGGATWFGNLAGDAVA